MAKRRHTPGDEKRRLQRVARARYGVGDLPTWFAAAGKELGVEWNGHKAHGYELLRQLAPAAPKSAPQVKPTYRPRLVAPPGVDVTSVDFLSTYAWRQLRMVVLTKRGARCECCGQTPHDGIVIHVDHIKPRRQYPELALDENNLQVLCEICNHGKGSWDQTDWRRSTAR
jgi:hypothetical protein